VCAKTIARTRAYARGIGDPFDKVEDGALQAAILDAGEGLHELHTVGGIEKLHDRLLSLGRPRGILKEE
jgi:hypothetical protein